MPAPGASQDPPPLEQARAGLRQAAAAGDFTAAGHLARAVLARQPQDAEALQLLGTVLASRGDLQEAESLLRRSLALHESAGGVKNLGVLLRRTGRTAEALPWLGRWRQLEPDSTQACKALARAALEHGGALMGQDRLEEAEHWLLQAVEADPASRAAWQRLGTLLHRVGESAGPLRPHAFDQSLEAYRNAARLDPAHPEAWFAIGALAGATGRVDEGAAAFQRVLEIEPGHALARLNHGMLLLQQGRLLEGWRECSVRGRAVQRRLVRPRDVPEWDGQRVAGLSFLVCNDQGVGDLVQFVRYVPLLKARGAARVAVACPEALASLVARMPGVDAIETRLGAHSYDCWVECIDLPMHFGTTLDTIPVALPYLGAAPRDVRRWARRLPADDLLVGLVWKGSPAHHNDLHRSLPGLATLAPLWRTPGARFVSLQKGAGEEEARLPPAGQPITDLGPELVDFSDTAAVVSCLDLVITVDTSVAHLAGALGRPVWVLLPAYAPDWRWLLDRDDSPWYPGVMRLFRQPHPGDWPAVIEAVAARLASFVAQETRQLGR